MLGIHPDFKLKLTEIFFEKLKIGSINFITSTTSQLFANGFTSGVVVEISENFSNISPIFGVITYFYPLETNNIDWGHSR